MTRARLINTDLDDEQLELANWLRKEPSEHRLIDDDIYIFIYPAHLDELITLLKKHNDDYFTNGTMELEFNGVDLVINTSDICTNCNIDPKLIYDPDEEDED